ncbi:MAG TPA: MFS transporter [Pyrinomonadaceae bacterium]|nr:MFS transporter [Pyrinomonadaceae bacterium]
MSDPTTEAKVEEAALPSGGRATLAKNDRREVFGWMMYDWANSAFFTTVVGAMFGPYLTSVAQAAVGEEGAVISFGSLYSISAKSFFPLCVSLAVLLQVVLLPVLGAVADYSHWKKRLMAAFCYAGAACTCLMFFVTPGRQLLGGLLFILAVLCINASIVLYNSYLPQITTEDRRDRVSSRGFALGYLGGGLLLVVNLALVQSAPRLGISTGTAVRLALLSAGVWWGGFALFTFSRLRPRPAARVMPAGYNYLSIGFSELRRTFGELRRLRHTLRFLVAYLFYIDGVQTVISMASVFLAQELFAARGLETDPSFLIGIFLLVQFVAIAGALIFERLARVAGTKWAIFVAVVIWSGLVIYAYAFLQTTRQAWGLGAVIGLVLGGVQALSRSLYSRMIPAGREAAFFGLYEISERASWMGTLMFFFVVNATGSYRQAILFLISFFIIGLVILLVTDADRAVHEAGNLLPEEVGGTDGQPALAADS